MHFKRKLDEFTEYLVSEKISEYERSKLEDSTLDKMFVVDFEENKKHFDIELEDTVNLARDGYSVIIQNIKEITRELEEGDKFTTCFTRDIMLCIIVHSTKKMYQVKYTYSATAKADEISNLVVRRLSDNADFIKKYNSYNADIEFEIDTVKVKLRPKKVYEKNSYIEEGMTLDLSYTLN